MDTAAIAVLATAAAALVSALTGWLQKRSDERRGIRSDEREDLDSLQSRYEKYVERIEGRLDDVETDLSTLRTELADERRRYRAALEHIRALTRWIARHVSPDVPGPPQPPEHITDDL